jgi:pyruvate/2-oxoglutarate/acetoin dehydrogenase E1 component
MRPVVEIMFADLMGLCADQVVNLAAKIRYMTGGQVRVPLVIRTACGGGLCAGATHSQSLEAWFYHVPGLKVAMPSTPYDAKGLLKTAIREDNPVLFIEHKGLYSTRGMVPEGEYAIPFGKADIKRGGDNATVVATAKMVTTALGAAEKLAEEGIEIEVVDPRTLVPLDMETILSSFRKTGKLVVVEEAIKRGSAGADICSTVVEEAFDYLDGPIVRVGAPSVPFPFSPHLEKLVIPTEEDIIQAVWDALA